MAIVSGRGKATNEPANFFAIGVQGAFGEPVKTTFFYTKHLNGTGFDVESQFKAERIGGGGREVGLIYKNLIKADGSFVTYAYPEVTGRLFAYALGLDTVASKAGGIQEHKIVSGSATGLPYLTLVQKYADEAEIVTNIIGAELKFEGQQGMPLKITMPFFAGGSVYQLQGGSLTAYEAAVTRESHLPYMYPGASANVNVAAASGGSGKGPTYESAELTKFTLGIKNNLDETIQTLALTRTDVVWETADYSLDGTLKYVDHEIWNKINYFGGSNTNLNLATGTFDFFVSNISNASAQLHIKVPIVTFGSAKLNRLDPDGKTMFLDFSGLTQYNAGTNSIIVESLADSVNATLPYTASEN